MDASIVDIARGINLREPARQAASPARGFERHFADERSPAAPPERSGPAARQRPEEKLRPQADEEVPPSEGLDNGQTERGDGACCVSSTEEAAATPAAGAGAGHEPASEPSDETELDAGPIIVAAVLEVVLVAPPPVLDTAILETGTVAPVTLAETPLEATALAEPALDAGLETPPVTSEAKESSESLTPVSERANAAPTIPPIKAAPVKNEEELPVAGEMSSAESKEPTEDEATNEAPRTGSARSGTAKANKALLREGNQGEPQAEPAVAPLDSGSVSSAPTLTTDSASPEPAGASASSVVPDEGPPPVSANAAQTSRASDAAGPPPLSSRLPAHLVGRGELAEQSPRGHDAEQVRLLQRVARAFETAHARDGELRIRLSPPELGSLRLEIKVQEGVMTARLEAETPEAKAILLDNLSALRERLAEQNMKIDRFDVDLMDRNTQGHANHPQDEPAPAPPRNLPPREAEVDVLEPDSVAGARMLGAGKLNVVV